MAEQSVTRKILDRPELMILKRSFLITAFWQVTSIMVEMIVKWYPLSFLSPLNGDSIYTVGYLISLDNIAAPYFHELLRPLIPQVANPQERCRLTSKSFIFGKKKNKTDNLYDYHTSFSVL